MHDAPQRLRKVHQQLGPLLDLFHQEFCAAGGVYWHAPGLTMRLALIAYIQRSWRALGFGEVLSPILAAYPDSMPAPIPPAAACEHYLVPTAQRPLALAQQPCAAHRQLLEHRIRSRQSFPHRYAEFASCHRQCRTNALCGLLRSTEYSVDTLHIFCLPTQVAAEVESLHEHAVRLLRSLDLLGFGVLRVRGASPRLAHREECAGQTQFRRVVASVPVDEERVVATEPEGTERIDYLAQDRDGSFWRMGTIRCGCTSAARQSQGSSQRCSDANGVATLHGSIIGSIERCIALVIERYGVTLPAWLAPVQVTVIGADGSTNSHVRDVVKLLEAAGIRTCVESERLPTPDRPSEPRHRAAGQFTVVVEAHIAGLLRYVTIRCQGTGAVERLPLEQALSRLSRECSLPS